MPGMNSRAKLRFRLATASSTGSTVNPFRWIGAVGYYYDANRTAYYVRARTYSPNLMRWLSRDPIGFAGGNGNLFRYVSNNPVNYYDPYGLFLDGGTLTGPAAVATGAATGITAAGAAAGVAAAGVGVCHDRRAAW